MATFAETTIGEARSLLTPETFAHGPPHQLFDRLRAEAPVFSSQTQDGRRVWSLTRHADVRLVSGDPKTFTSTWGPAFNGQPLAKNAFPGNVMFADPPEHDRLRHFFKLAFGPRVVRNFEPWIRELALEIIDEVKLETGTFDFVARVAAELPAMVIAAILGMPREDRKQMVHWANDVLASTEGSAEGAATSLAARTSVMQYAMELRERKRHQPADDMVSMLLDAEYQGVPMSDQEYRMFVFTTMVAGYETTHTAIAQSMLFLMNNAEAYREFHSLEEVGVNNALTELLRHVTPAMQMARTTTVDVEIDGTTIPAGEQVIMWLTAANRDPAVFEDPHRVDFQRKNSAIATFGAGGPHFCIGNQLARLEMRLLFEECFRQDVRFEQAGDIVRMKSMMINGIREMPVRIVR